ncbi:MAG: cytochrome c maturation protein CcmE [Bacteroidota bacterium]
MKKIHIALIVVIAILLGVIISTVSESGTYVSFKTAAEKPDRTYHVIGKVNLQKEFIYHPEQDANVFGFYMTDTIGTEKRVYFNGTKPQDFEKAEKIVVVGKIKGEDFIASQVLMKCPSKYNKTGEGEEWTTGGKRPQ